MNHHELFSFIQDFFIYLFEIGSQSYLLCSSKKGWFPKAYFIKIYAIFCKPKAIARWAKNWHCIYQTCHKCGECIVYVVAYQKVQLYNTCNEYSIWLVGHTNSTIYPVAITCHPITRLCNEIKLYWIFELIGWT